MNNNISRFLHYFNTKKIQGKHVNCVMDMCEEEKTRKDIIITPSISHEKSEIDTSLELMRTMHSLPGTHSFEIRNHEDTKLLFSINESLLDRFRTLLLGWFPSFELEVIDRSFPNMNTGEYISISNIFLSNDNRLQILNPLGADSMHQDPYERIFREIEQSSPETRVLLQIAFKPAEETWYNHNNKKGIYEKTSRLIRRTIPITSEPAFSLGDLINRLSTEREGKVVSRLKSQEKEVAFVANIRLVAISNNRKNVREITTNVNKQLQNLYSDEKMGQKLCYRSVMKNNILKSVRKFVRCSVGKNWRLPTRHHCEPVMLTAPELASLAHFPSTKKNGIFFFESRSIDYLPNEDTNT